MRKKVVRRPRKRVVKRKQPLLKMVKQMVLKNQETKISSNVYTITGFNSSINSAGDFIACLPPVSLGTAQNNRIGASIKPIKMVIRGFICYRNDANSGARMIGTRLFCFSDKTTSNYAVLNAAGPNYNLLDQGGNAIPFTGQVIQYCMPHNTDAYRWYADKKHVIRKPYGLTNTLAPSVNNDITSMDASLFKPFTITIPASKMPSNLKYEETISTNSPVNFAPLLALGYTDLQGYPADTTNTQINMEFVATLYYKDA